MIVAKKILRDLIELLTNTFKGFLNDKVLKLSGSLAYSTIFSMGPFFIIIISVCGIFFGRKTVEGKIYFELAKYLGRNTAMQLELIIKNVAISGNNQLAIGVGGVILFLGATSIFAEIQDSVNDIWGLKPKPKKNWLKMVQNRFISFSIIISLGFLLMVSLTLTAVIDGFGYRLQARFPGVTIPVFYIFNQVLTLIVGTLIFGVIFKVLPDANIKWKDVLVGSVVTSLLFMMVKFMISLYISKANVAGVFGAFGSLIVLLLWVYYSSLILYFGAEFTKAFAVKYGSEILPSKYAVTKKEVEIETGKSSVQETEKSIPSTSIKL